MIYGILKKLDLLEAEKYFYGRPGQNR